MTERSAAAGIRVHASPSARQTQILTEKALEFLGRMEAECGLRAGNDRVFLTGSGAGLIAPHIGGRFVQEVVAVSAGAGPLASCLLLRT